MELRLAGRQGGLAVTAMTSAAGAEAVRVESGGREQGEAASWSWWGFRYLDSGDQRRCQPRTVETNRREDGPAWLSRAHGGLHCPRCLILALVAMTQGVKTTGLLAAVVRVVEFDGKPSWRMAGEV